MKPMMRCGHVANGQRKIGDTWVPACVICSDTFQLEGTPHLENRVAACMCGKKQLSAEYQRLAFFQYRGEGSPDALNTCKHCKFHRIAHENKIAGKAQMAKQICDNFEPHGAWDFDSYYCGCRGWD